MEHANDSLVGVCLECVEACSFCAASCLNEENVAELTKCMQLDLECCAICKATAQLLTLQSNHSNAACQLCADICIACAEECEKHHHDHCRRCAAFCRECAEKCLERIAA